MEERKEKTKKDRGGMEMNDNKVLKEEDFEII